ncbi:MAG: hypothetical protein KA257_01130 [Opitutaceae bacterium]|nr:hypothetical protein [Opitutaceae bacterium]MBP9912123.1 hypothetical protein [Opitutaceae bacterium]
MKPHSDYGKLLKLWPHVQEFQKLATQHGIKDVFQDNGGKLLQMLLITGLAGMGAREGNDAVDGDGKEFELKSVNIDLTTQVSTHHHLNPGILAKYRKVKWIFAIYRSIELQEIWFMEPKQLEPWFAAQEEKWHARKRDLNNPKIPLTFVRANGVKFFPFAKPAPSLEKAEIAVESLIDKLTDRGRKTK